MTGGRLRFGRASRLPLILQAEAAECGLACIAMVAGYHGLEMDLPVLRSVGGVSLRGASLKQLMQLAANLGLATRPLRLEPGELGQLRCPAILHWDLTHFVVLKSVGRRHIVIHNPAVGVRRYVLEDASRHISGVALELWPAQTFEPRRVTQRMHLTDFWSKARGLTTSMLQVLVLSLVLQLVSLASPFYMQLIVDEAIVKRDLDLVSVLAVGFFLLTLIRVGTTALRAWVLVYFGNHMGFQMSAHLFRHLIRLPLAWFQRRHMGDVVSRFGSLEPIRRLFTEGLVSTVVDGLMAITTLVMMLVYSPLLTLVVMVAVVLYALGKLVFYPIERRRMEENIAASAREETSFMETVRAIQAIKVFGKEGERQTLWQNRQAEVINSGVAVARLGIGYNAWNAVLLGVENVLVIYLGARFVLEEVFSVGMLYAFVAYKSQFTERLSALVDRAMELRMVRLHLERLSDITITPPEKSLHISRIRPPVRGALSLDDVSFHYSESDPWVLEGVNLEIEPGEMVAILGPSGSGKSTLIKLLMGLYVPTRGSVRVDGESLERFGRHGYRACVAAVMQDDQLLAGSILDNIAFFDPEVDEAWVIECAQSAAIHDEILAMPMGYNTLIGDMGTALSGGQRQRLLFARALYARPRVLFSDEGTAHLDSENIGRVLKSIAELECTRVLVTHDPKVAQVADRQLVLDRSRVFEINRPEPPPALESSPRPR